MQRILKARKSFEHRSAVGNQVQIYYPKQRNSLSFDSIRRKTYLWPQNTSFPLNIHTMPGWKYASNLPYTDWKLKSKLPLKVNFVISNDNEILGWDSIPYPLLILGILSGTATALLLPQPGQHSTPGGVRSCLSREEEEREIARTELQVSGTATQARDLNFFWAASVLFWDRVNCSALVTCRKWLHGSNLSNPCLRRDATFVPLLKISPYSETPASKYMRQAMEQHWTELVWGHLCICNPFETALFLFFFNAALVID